jgi:hypothetical protein
MFLLATTPLAAQTIVFDPHLDLPTSAGATGWTGRGDPNAQFDLERATTGGLTIALLVPQEARDAASLAAAQQAFTVRDADPRHCRCQPEARRLRALAGGRPTHRRERSDRDRREPAQRLAARRGSRCVRSGGRGASGSSASSMLATISLPTAHACGCAAARPELRNSTFAAVLKDARQRGPTGAFHQADHVGGGRWWPQSSRRCTALRPALSA